MYYEVRLIRRYLDKILHALPESEHEINHTIEVLQEVSVTEAVETALTALERMRRFIEEMEKPIQNLHDTYHRYEKQLKNGEDTPVDELKEEVFNHKEKLNSRYEQLLDDLKEVSGSSFNKIDPAIDTSARRQGPDFDEIEQLPENHELQRIEQNERMIYSWLIGLGQPAYFIWDKLEEEEVDLAFEFFTKTVDVVPEMFSIPMWALLIVHMVIGAFMGYIVAMKKQEHRREDEDSL